MTSILRAVALSMVLCMAALPLHAFTLTVSGVNYQITLIPGSYTAVDTGPNGPLTTTPWFGNAALSIGLSEELRDQNNLAGGTLVPDPNALYLFARVSLSPGFITSSAYDPSLAVGTSSTFSYTTSVAATTTFAPGVPIYYATPVPVPEIDGNALAKALFCLLAFGLWLRVRRARAEARVTA